MEDKTEEIYKFKMELYREGIAKITGKLVKLVEENDKLFLAVMEDQSCKMVWKLMDGKTTELEQLRRELQR